MVLSGSAPDSHTVLQCTRTALHLTAFKLHDESARFLLNAKADPNSQDSVRIQHHTDSPMLRVPVHSASPARYYAVPVPLYFIKLCSVLSQCIVSNAAQSSTSHIFSPVMYVALISHCSKSGLRSTGACGIWRSKGRTSTARGRPKV